MELEQKRVLISCDPEFEAQALQELREMRPAMPAPAWVGDGVALCETGLAFDAFAVLVAERAPIFIRHIAPVQRAVDLRGEESDLETLGEAAQSLAPLLNPTRNICGTGAFSARGSASVPQVYAQRDDFHAAAGVYGRDNGV